MARYMSNEVPGVNIPHHLIERLEAAEARGNGPEEGVQIALELIQDVRKLRGQGIHGLHIMAVGWEEIVPRIVRDAGLGVGVFAPPQTAGTIEKQAATT